MLDSILLAFLHLLCHTLEVISQHFVQRNERILHLSDRVRIVLVLNVQILDLLPRILLRLLVKHVQLFDGLTET